jgi:hypothetical protein
VLPILPGSPVLGKDRQSNGYQDSILTGMRVKYQVGPCRSWYCATCTEEGETLAALLLKMGRRMLGRVRGHAVLLFTNLFRSNPPNTPPPRTMVCTHPYTVYNCFLYPHGVLVHIFFYLISRLITFLFSKAASCSLYKPPVLLTHPMDAECRTNFRVAGS